MKKTGILLVFALLTIFLFSGCEKVQEKLEFEFEMGYSTTITVPSSIGISIPLSLPTPEMESRAEEKFESEGTESDLVKEIRLKSTSLRILSPAGKTFSFLNSVQIFLNADGLPEILLASKNNIDDSIGNQLLLDTSDDFLDAYVKSPMFSLRSEIVTDETLFQDVEIQIDVVFQVVADPI